jgi:Acetyltransferase (GNAT) domain
VTTFHSGPPPQGFKPDVQYFLFNTKTHRQLQSRKGWAEFHLCDPKKKKILSSIFFHVDHGKAFSPFRAPFGSFEISDRVHPKEFFEFVLWIDSELIKKRIERIEIVCPPEMYVDYQPMITLALRAAGYDLVQVEPGCCILVDDQPLLKKMRPNKKNIFRQGERAKLAFKNLSLGKLGDVYHFLEACSKEKGRSLSMTLPDLTKTVKALPKSFQLFGSFLNNELVAASIIVRVSPSIGYTFYSGHARQFDRLSPLVFLIGHLYDWCRAQNISLLDLGTSALDGKPNFNLLNFKLRLGGKLTPKYKFQKTLTP